MSALTEESIVEREQDSGTQIASGGEIVYVQTAIEARTDSVARILDSAYQQASKVNLTNEERVALLADFPDEEVQTGADGNADLLYIEHMSIRMRLLKVLGPGGWALITRRIWVEQFKTSKGGDAFRLYAECVLLIRGCFAGEGIGTGMYYLNNAKQDYADASESAKSFALRRAAKEFGVGLQVWNKSWCKAWKQRQLSGHRREPQQQQGPLQQVQQTPADQGRAFVTAMTRWDGKLVSAGLCIAGEFLQFLPQFGHKYGFPTVLVNWPKFDMEGHKKIANEAFDKFKAQCEAKTKQPPACKQAEPDEPMDSGRGDVDDSGIPF